MKSLIVLLLIALVSSNEMIETKIKLRRTADFELNQIVDFLKEYFEKALDLYFQGCENTVNYFESKKYEQFFNKIIQTIQDIKNFLSKYTFDELKEKFILYFEKFKIFINEFNPDFIIDYILEIIDNFRSFIAITYFDENIEQYVGKFREIIMELKLYVAEGAFYSGFSEFLLELNRINIKKVIKEFVKEFDRSLKNFNEEQFKQEIEKIKNEFQKEVIKMENELSAFKNYMPQEISKLKEQLRNLPDELEQGRHFQEISDYYSQIKAYIDNFDINQVLKVVQYVLEKYVSKITKKNLESIYNQIKEYIKKLKDYISEENYNYLIQYFDALIELSTKETEKIDIIEIKKKIENFLNTIQGFFKNLDPSGFLTQFKAAFSNLINYIVEYNFEEPINKLIDYSIRVTKVYYQFNFGYITTIYTLIYKTIQTFSDSMPQVYNKNNVVIYGDDFFS